MDNFQEMIDLDLQFNMSKHKFYHCINKIRRETKRDLNRVNLNKMKLNIQLSTVNRSVIKVQQLNHFQHMIKSRHSKLI